MKNLSDCPRYPAIHLKGKHSGAIVDKKTGQRLELTSTEKFAAFSFPDQGADAVDWGPGKRPDGVIVSNISGLSSVCFVETKGKRDDEKAYKQLEGGAKHFAPVGRSGKTPTHGDEHHDNWTKNEDDIDVDVDKDHLTLGVFVTSKEEPRDPAATISVGGKKFPRKVVIVPKSKPNWHGATVEEILRTAGVIA